MAREELSIEQVPEDAAGLRAFVQRIRADFDSHNHDGANSRNFQTLKAETLSARALSIRKTSYNDNTAGLLAGIVDGSMKLNVGSESSYLKWDGSAISIAGSITATSGTIGGWIIGATTLSSASSGERVVLDKGNTKISLFNSSGTEVVKMAYGSANTDPLITFTQQNDDRYGIKIVTTSAMTRSSLWIDNDATDVNSYGMLLQRDASTAGSLIAASIICNNAGAGDSYGIDIDADIALLLTGSTYIMQATVDGTSPVTSVGRVAFKDGLGNTRYLNVYS